MAHHSKKGKKKRYHRHWDPSKTGRGRAARIVRKRKSRKSASKRGNYGSRSKNYKGK